MTPNIVFSVIFTIHSSRALGWVYIKVWGLKHMFMDFTFELKIEPKLED